jgi:hypothetical protein
VEDKSRDDVTESNTKGESDDDTAPSEKSATGEQARAGPGPSTEENLKQTGGKKRRRL